MFESVLSLHELAVVVYNWAVLAYVQNFSALVEHIYSTPYSFLIIYYLCIYVYT